MGEGGGLIPLLVARARRPTPGAHSMPDLAVVHADQDLEDRTLAPKPPTPKPDPRWIRARRVLGFPLRLLVGILKYLWNLACW